MFTNSRLVGWLLVGLLGAGPALGQSAINKVWGRTDLDTVISVRTPYRAQDIQEANAPGVTTFFTKGSYNHFVMVRMDMPALLRQRLESSAREGHPARPDSGVVTLDIEKCLRLMLKSPLLVFGKPKMSREYVVSLPAAPGGQASHRVYTGVDPNSREAALLEVRWFEREGIVYFFFCTTVDPNGEEARQEKQKYFGTIALQQ